MRILTGLSIRSHQVELFHHSQDTPAYVSKLLSTVDRSTGQVVKKSPRVLTKGVSAEIQITLRSSGGSGKAYSVPLETFATNKEMGRVLIRRGGETIAAGEWKSFHRDGLSSRYDVETDLIQPRHHLVH
jgi:elongation factor 1 alpha-like protein